MIILYMKYIKELGIEISDQHYKNIILNIPFTLYINNNNTYYYSNNIYKSSCAKLLYKVYDKNNDITIQSLNNYTFKHKWFNGYIYSISVSCQKFTKPNKYCNTHNNFTKSDKNWIHNASTFDTAIKNVSRDLDISTYTLGNVLVKYINNSVSDPSNLDFITSNVPDASNSKFINKSLIVYSNDPDPSRCNGSEGTLTIGIHNNTQIVQNYNSRIFFGNEVLTPHSSPKGILTRFGWNMEISVDISYYNLEANMCGTLYFIVPSFFTNSSDGDVTEFYIDTQFCQSFEIDLIEFNKYGISSHAHICFGTKDDFDNDRNEWPKCACKDQSGFGNTLNGDDLWSTGATYHDPDQGAKRPCLPDKFTLHAKLYDNSAGKAVFTTWITFEGGKKSLDIITEDDWINSYQIRSTCNTWFKDMISQCGLVLVSSVWCGEGDHGPGGGKCGFQGAENCNPRKYGSLDWLSDVNISRQYDRPVQLTLDNLTVTSL